MDLQMMPKLVNRLGKLRPHERWTSLHLEARQAEPQATCATMHTPSHYSIWGSGPFIKGCYAFQA